VEGAQACELSSHRRHLRRVHLDLSAACSAAAGRALLAAGGLTAAAAAAGEGTGPAPPVSDLPAAAELRRRACARRIARWYARWRQRRRERHAARQVEEAARGLAAERMRILAELREQAMEELRLWRRRRACEAIQRWWRRRLRRRCAAASKIQSAWRQRQARLAGRAALELRRAAAERAAALDAAATRVQAAARGRLARRRAEGLREQRRELCRACLAVQSMWRGRAGRLRALRRRQELERAKQLRLAAARTILRAYRACVRRRQGAVVLHFERLQRGYATPKALDSFASTIQRWFRRQALLRWATREHVKVGKLVAAMEHQKRMDESDAYRTRFQAPVTTAGIGYVVVTSRPFTGEPHREATNTPQAQKGASNRAEATTPIAASNDRAAQVMAPMSFADLPGAANGLQHFAVTGLFLSHAERKERKPKCAVDMTGDEEATPDAGKACFTRPARHLFCRSFCTRHPSFVWGMSNTRRFN